MLQIVSKPLSTNDYKPFGEVIEIRDDMEFIRVNMGLAKRFNHVAKMENLRGEKANANMCLFRLNPIKELPIKLTLLEKHPYSTQVLVPMIDKHRYLIVICEGGEKPDLAVC